VLKSIRGRFALWYVGSLAALTIAAFLITEILFRFVFIGSVDRRLDADAQALARALRACRRAGEVATPSQECLDRHLRLLFPRTVAYAQLREVPANPDATPQVVARSYSMLDDTVALSREARPALGRSASHYQSVAFSGSDPQRRFVTLMVRDPGQTPYFLQFGLRASERGTDGARQQRSAVRPHLFIVVFPLLVLGATAWSYFLMRRVFAPIRTVVTLARRISAEDLSHRIKGVESCDEIGELVETLNEMIARLERSFRQTEQFSSDVAHELRTPLTIIRGEVEVTLTRERTVGEYRATLASLLEEVERLSAMIEDLLLVARMAARQQTPLFGVVELDALVMEVYEEAAALGRAKGVTVGVQPLEEAHILGEPGLLKRLFANLLRNALNYTNADGRVTVSLVTTAHEVTVEICDTGCGIPADALPFVFDRFYRVDPSRSHETGGTGLGLAIVQKIAEAHRAKLDVRSQVGRGSTFRVTFPRA
jgi:heavy metal sensor kinase